MSFPSFHIQTYGCQMNASDSDWLRRSLISRGFTEAPFEEAGLYIINTCSVREKPEKKVYSELGRIARYCKVNKRENITVCVGGCVAQQVGTKLARRFPQVRLIFGTDGVSHAPRAIERILEQPSLRINLLDFADRYEERDDPWLAEQQNDADEIQNLLPLKNSFTTKNSNKSESNHSAKNTPEHLVKTKQEKESSTLEMGKVPPSVFVNIMQGCNNFCTYCIVPYVRGRQKSRSSIKIIEECQGLLANGAREITLLGQNVNSYGQDKSGDGVPFATLLHSVAKLPNLERLRFVTPHPKDIAPEVIAAFGEMDVLCPRLHLPLQSGSDEVLKKMGRHYTVEKFLGIVQALRRVRPEIVFTTDIIVGFPGETEKDFEQTLAVMREVGFVSSFSFVYSDRPGAKAVLFPGKVERKEALERLSRLQAEQNNASEKELARYVGTTQTILLENKSARDPMPPKGKEHEATPLPTGFESWQGKTDKGYIVNVTLESNHDWTGRMLHVSIEAAARHSLKGKQVGAPW